MSTKTRNPERRDRSAKRFELLCRAADLVVADGLAYARADDPHRFATLPQEFDQGKAMPRLMLDYKADGKVQVTMLTVGTLKGATKMVEIFATTLQGPVPGAAH